MLNLKCNYRHSLWLWGLIVVFAGCTRNPQQPKESTSIDDFVPESSRKLAPQDIKTEFVELTNMVAERAPVVVAKMLANARIMADSRDIKTEISFKELDLDGDLPRYYVTKDNRILEVTLEQAQPCNVKPQTPTSSIIFAPDPDRFESDEEVYLCKGLLVENGVVKPVAFSLAEYESILSHIPLYFVGYQERPSPEQVESTSGSSLSQNRVAAPGGLVACHKIHMKKDHDPGSNEECEVYTHSPTSGGVYNNVTNFVFDGHTHLDARNRSVYFPDVNTTEAIYECVELPIFFTLLPANQGFVAIEDDYGKGRHIRNVCQFGGCTPYFPYQFYAAVDVANADGSKVWGTTRKFEYDYWPEIQSSDDIWQSGCYEKFNLDWQPPLNDDVWLALNDTEFWMQRVFF